MSVVIGGETIVGGGDEVVRSRRSIVGGEDRARDVRRSTRRLSRDMGDGKACDGGVGGWGYTYVATNKGSSGGRDFGLGEDSVVASETESDGGRTSGESISL